MKRDEPAEEERRDRNLSGEEPTITASGGEDGHQQQVADAPAVPLPGRIGQYRIISCLGEGGMGVVYLAEQTEPVQRRVALKVMKSALNNDESRLRFSAERQALARLQHPNVAQMFDAGTTEDGFPFFAMELIEGRTILSYSDEEQLRLQDRLRLFSSICDGVHHAHQKGVLHRDLTPANILVTEIDGRPVPKIIDFGIAKALDQPLIEKTLLTGERVIGTPAYLSPEAIDGGIDVDTRSDVYSLGVLLYELLVGVRPFETRGRKLIQVLRLIAEDDPTGPSTRWTTLDADSKGRIARQRGLDTASLRRRLRGDLDWIVLKAIAKDRNHRYGSPAELAADITRHLRHQPVEASPPSRLYRVVKFVRRRRGVVATLLLLACAGVKYTLDLRQEQQRTLAALQEAEQARNEAQQVADFLVGVFEEADPNQALGNEITAREILDQGAARLEHGLSDQPLVRARLLATIGIVYEHLGLHQEAADLLEQALALRRAAAPADQQTLATNIHRLGLVYYMLDRYDEAAQMFEEALQMRRRALPPDHPEIAASLEELARLRFDHSEFDQARDLVERCVEIRRRSQTRPDPRLASALKLLAEVAAEQGRHEQAGEAFQEAIAILESAVPDSPPLATALETYASYLLEQGSTGEAAVMFQRSLAIREKTLGPDHPNLGITASYLGYVSMLQGRFSEAEERLLQAQEVFKRTLGAEHFNVGANLVFLGNLYRQTGRFDKAEAAYRRSQAIWEALGLSNSPNAVTTRAGLAEVAYARQEYAVAEKSFRSILDEQLRSTGRTGMSVAYRLWLAETVLRQGRRVEAEEMLAQALEGIGELETSTSSQEILSLRAAAKVRLGVILASQGRDDVAQQLWQEALDDLVGLASIDSDLELVAMHADVLLRLGRTAAAAPLVQRLREIGVVDTHLDQLCREKGLALPS